VYGGLTAATLAMTAVLAGRVLSAAAGTEVIQTILDSHPEWFADVLERAAAHRLQILYTQIDTTTAT
jgi:hypothetical protein